MSEILFCERNLKGWIAFIAVFAVFVLSFSIWSGVGKKDINIKLSDSSLGTGKPVGGTRQTTAETRASIRFVGKIRSKIQSFNQVADFNRVVDLIRPCVVNINAVSTAPLPRTKLKHGGTAPRFIDPFDRMPDKFIGRVAFESVGSGVIIDPAGYVITNYHVVAKATNILVTRFQDKDGQYPARILVSDPGKDLALLQIMGKGPFPAAVLADSNQVEVGDWVLAVGNPFGLGHTVTAGIISGRRSSLVISGVRFKGLLQTDAPTNRGSSGGPLVNMNGQVVGINTAIYAPTGVFNGTGFSIPSNRVGAFVARFVNRKRGV